MNAAADATTSRSRSLRSLLAEDAAANLRTFEPEWPDGLASTKYGCIIL
jgi:hypothetical protein